jgi:hypothetical protein
VIFLKKIAGSLLPRHTNSIDAMCYIWAMVVYIIIIRQLLAAALLMDSRTEKIFSVVLLSILLQNCSY